MRCERAVTPHGELYGVARSRGAALRRGRAAAGSRRCTHCAPQLISRAGAASESVPGCGARAEGIQSAHSPLNELLKVGG